VSGGGVGVFGVQLVLVEYLDKAYIPRSGYARVRERRRDRERDRG
jgi:hypothetical protein